MRSPPRQRPSLAPRRCVHGHAHAVATGSGAVRSRGGYAQGGCSPQALSPSCSGRAPARRLRLRAACAVSVVAPPLRDVQALQQWSQLQQRLAPGLRPPQQPSSQLAAAEAAARLVSRLVEERAEAQLLMDDEVAESRLSAEVRAHATSQPRWARVAAAGTQPGPACSAMRGVACSSVRAGADRAARLPAAAARVRGGGGHSGRHGGTVPSCSTR